MIRIYLTLAYFSAIIVLKMRILENNSCKGQKMNNKELVGIIKGFDKLGRIVIPKELRERYSLSDSVEIIATTDGVLLKNPEYILIKKVEK